MSTELTVILDAIKSYGPSAVAGVRIGVDAYKAAAAALRRRYEDHSAAVQQQAIANASDAAHRIGRKIDALIETGAISEEQAEAAMQRPDLAKLLERVILDSSETTSELKHEQLANLVALAFKNAPESPEAVAARIACSLIPNTTVAQLRLLALVFFMRSVKANDPPFSQNNQLRLDRFASETERYFLPISDIIPRYADAAQLEAIGFLRLQPFVGGQGIRIPTGHCASIQYAHEVYSGLAPTTSDILDRLSATMNGNEDLGTYGVRTMTTTPIGHLVGSAVYSQLSGIPLSVSLDMESA